jgi:hypothetical protein
MNTNNVISVSRLKSWIHSQILINETALQTELEKETDIDTYINQCKAISSCGGELAILEKLFKFINKDSNNAIK